jgi:uncharacterized protein YyaL (SSP411 family)
MDNLESVEKAAVNRLVREKSPYLIQHAHNPVDWYPWGDEAFSRAKSEDKPIFLSIGYATCHWCHVMAHESFEDKDVARLLNESFISIKVDREERPDIDQIYMSVCQALTGSGGWPLSIFMTQEGKPFFAGTYFPKARRMGMSSFTELLTHISTMWRTDRARILKASEEVTQAVQPKPALVKEGPTMGIETLKKGYIQLSRSFDPKWGGFGSAPKFPTPHQLTFLLRWYRRSGDSAALDMVEKTLDYMHRGGLFDQIGFGFHRYSVDERWLAPHFEKMLYDQALLAVAYTEAYQITEKESYGSVTREILKYVLRDMTSPEGGFYSAEDADTEGKEGLFYLWKPEEIKRCLGDDIGELFCRFYDVSKTGNFEEGYSILHVPSPLKTFAEREGMEPAELEAILSAAREELFHVREKKIHPLKDDKILTSWNGLMIAAFAKASQALDEPAYAEAAGRAADFILGKMRKSDGSLLRRYREGEVAYSAFLDDYAFLVWGLIELYEATFEVAYLEEAIAISSTMIDQFWDSSAGGLFFSGSDNEALITRTKEIYDGALPSGNSVAVLNLLRLGRITGDSELENRADQLTRSFSAQIDSYPMAHTQFLIALDFTIGPNQEIVIAGDPAAEITKAMIAAIHRVFLPNKALLFRPEGDAINRLCKLSPFVEMLHPVEDQPTVFLCEQYACKTPIRGVDDFKSAIRSLGTS